MGARVLRLASTMCVLTGAAAVLSAGAHATTFTPAPGHAVRLGMTQQIVGRDGSLLFAGTMGYNGNVVPGSFWVRQDATSLVVGTYPSGGLGKAPLPAQVLFKTPESAPADFAQPKFTLDGSAQSGDPPSFRRSEG